MKWYFHLNRKVQMAIPLICIAISTFFFIVGGTIFLLIGAVLLIIGISFVFLFYKAEKQRKAEQSFAHPQTRDPVINEHDSTESIIKLARKRASEIIQKGDTAVQARIREIEVLIMPEAEREKLNNPSDIPVLQRQVALIYEKEALLQYLQIQISNGSH